MLANLKNVVRVPDLRNKVFFTLAIMAMYRLGSFIPAPGVDVDALQELQKSAESGGGVLAFLTLFSGGALTRFSVFALGIMPYITASIIIQILGVVIPKLEQWQNQGAVGQRKITQWTRYLTIAIAGMQGTGMAVVFHQGGGGFGRVNNPLQRDVLPNFSVWTVLLLVLTLAAGTAVLMWMGELVTQKGIGNGMSLLVFASVVSSLPSQLGLIVKSDAGIPGLTAFLAGFLVILFAIVFVEQGQRRIPVQFAKRQVGRRMIGGQNTYIPLKVNPSGVVPIIFASSVLYLPQLLSFVLPTGQDSWGVKVQEFVNNYIVQQDSLVHVLVFGFLILAFAYFYTAIIFDPIKQADNIRKQGGFIPGIRPGPATERYLSKVVSRITLPGAVFIAIVALVPSLVMARFLKDQSTSFSGISILIAVGVALETMKQIDSQLMMRNYEGFLK